MTLEFERLTSQLDAMARTAASRQGDRQSFVDDLLAVMARYAEDWQAIDQALFLAEEKADPKHYRAARPLRQNHPLNVGIDPPPAPPQATLIATDGSQIMPDRHAPYLYYVLNVGGCIYFYGSGRTPIQFTHPELHYPESDAQEADFLQSSSKVSIERDKREITILANTAWDYRHEEAPVLAMLDQRLLYWPIGDSQATPNEDVQTWLRGMLKTKDSGAWLTGYIDRPMTGYVVTLLLALSGLDDLHFNWSDLGKRGVTGGLADAAVYGRLLQPGQRSPVFVNISPPNEQFARFDPGLEVCFFYLNPGNSGRRIARVDIPRWVAEDETAVNQLHALIMDQCRQLGGYPYIITRADEMAVIQYADRESLETMIDNYMQRYGIYRSLTAKLQTKGLSRSTRRRYGQ